MSLIEGTISNNTLVDIFAPTHSLRIVQPKTAPRQELHPIYKKHPLSLLQLLHANTIVYISF